MATDSIYRAVLLQEQDGISLVNVLHFKQLSDEVTDEIPEEALATVLSGALFGGLKAASSESKVYQGMIISQVDPGPFPGITFVEPSGAGSLPLIALPPDQCPVITLYSEELSKHGRGRQYHSGISLESHKHGMISGELFTLLQDAYTPLTAAMSFTGTTVTWRCVIWSEANGVAYPVTQINVSPELRTMRSRTR